MKKVEIVAILLLILCWTVFYEPAMISDHYEGIHNVYNIFKLCILALIFIVYLLRLRISKIVLCIVMYQVYITFITFYMDGSISRQLMSSLIVIGCCMFCEIVISYSPKAFLNSLISFFEICIIINFLTILIYPDGMYMTERQSLNWFLGYDNKHITFILPVIALLVFRKDYLLKKYSLLDYITFGVSFSTIIARMPATSVMAVLMYSFYILFREKLKIKALFNILNYCILSVGLHIGIVFVRIQNIFSFVIVDILGKSLTFTNRTLIWDATIIQIKEHLLFGQGFQPYPLRILQNNYRFAVSAHNRPLEVLYQGGLIGFALFIAMLYQTGKNLMKYRDSNLAGNIAFTLFVFFIMMITEVLDCMAFYCFIMMGFHIRKFIARNGDVV